jgi:hypothetical protein
VRVTGTEFIEMQKRNKFGVNNPQFGNVKSPATIAKLTKLVYVYNFVDLSYIGSYSTVQCSKEFNPSYPHSCEGKRVKILYLNIY